MPINSPKDGEYDEGEEIGDGNNNPGNPDFENSEDYRQYSLYLIIRKSNEVLSPRLHPRKSLDKVHSANRLGKFEIEKRASKGFRSKSNVRMINPSDISNYPKVHHLGNPFIKMGQKRNSNSNYPNSSL